MTIPADAYARPRQKPQRYMTDIDMPFAFPDMGRELKMAGGPELPPFMPPGAAPGAEDRIRQLQRMRGQENPQQKFQVWPDPPPGQGPRQVAPDPQPPQPTPQPRSVLLRRGMQ
jgi:hypothetical protein